MAFLDNSGDIILDAVLTDTGRMRLAKGDGSFRVAKFALADDEIDYSLYNYNNASGSAYFDLEILQTPVFEAFSNNVASMKSKLISISRNNLLYLPVMKVNNLDDSTKFVKATSLVQNGYVLAVDNDTEIYLNTAGIYYGTTAGTFEYGVIDGYTINSGTGIRIDQGLDTTALPVSQLDPDLVETQYLIEIDNRFASVVSVFSSQTNVVQATPSYIDDDNIATYYFSKNETGYVSDLPNDPTNSVGQVIAGPRGTSIQFRLKSQNDVKSNDYLFNTLGTDITSGFVGGAATNVRGILTNIRVVGVTTGNVVDIPLMIVKKIAP